ncbi:adenine phosphoribosyltransferase [Kordiimonas pumila]|uniref:Adenine phosphoribosyltransferase n=1 Tax=Kordiimonas pumila TaxID=2161677 RepID=A0ABV7D6T1_9PROT|nr:adenine phosphoribosyltransferase [Kordiimonas pumila]
MALKDYIRTIPDFPKPGILFRDVTSLFADAAGFELMLDSMVNALSGIRFDVIAGIDARGFIVGAALAGRLQKGFVPLRKEGKLPGSVIRVAYRLEYGEAVLEVHTGSFKKGMRVLLIDDLIATGGTAEAGVQLIKAQSADIAACAFVVDLPDLGGSARLQEAGHTVISLCSFEGA